MSSGRLLERPAEDLKKCNRNAQILGIVRVQFKERVRQPTRDEQLRKVEKHLRWQLQNSKRLKVSESTEMFEGSPKRAYEIFENFAKRIWSFKQFHNIIEDTTFVSYETMKKVVDGNKTTGTKL